LRQTYMQVMEEKSETIEIAEKQPEKTLAGKYF
jgi:hypothetical protein